MIEGIAEFIRGIPTPLLNDLFSIYIALVIAFNCVSFVVMAKTGKPLLAHDPAAGIINFVIVYLVFSAGASFNAPLFVLISSVLIALIVYVGFLKHLLGGYHPEHYKTYLSWLLPILINLFGIPVLVISMLHQVL